MGMGCACALLYPGTLPTATNVANAAETTDLFMARSQTKDKVWLNRHFPDALQEKAD